MSNKDIVLKKVDGMLERWIMRRGQPDTPTIVNRACSDESKNSLPQSVKEEIKLPTLTQRKFGNIVRDPYTIERYCKKYTRYTVLVPEPWFILRELRKRMRPSYYLYLDAISSGSLIEVTFDIPNSFPCDVWDARDIYNKYANTTIGYYSGYKIVSYNWTYQAFDSLHTVESVEKLRRMQECYPMWNDPQQLFMKHKEGFNIQYLCDTSESITPDDLNHRLHLFSAIRELWRVFYKDVDERDMAIGINPSKSVDYDDPGSADHLMGETTYVYRHSKHTHYVPGTRSGFEEWRTHS